MVSARNWILAIVVLYTLGGFLAGLSGAGTYEAELAFGAIAVYPLYVFTYLWMKADARERAVASPPGAIPLVPVLFPIAVMYHLLSTRQGWRRGLALLWLLGFTALVLSSSILASMAGEWLGQRTV